MKILSLFDGMACGMLAMMHAGVTVDSYDAYEIDKYAVKTAEHNFPQIRERGDVFKADFTEYEGVDFVVGGSPCTYWSIAQTKNRETTASGMGWELFSQYVRAVREAKPRYFIYENNKSMSKDIRKSITETFGFEPICINSALVSAQNRQRLYWVGIRQADGSYRKADIEQPADRGIMLKDVLDGAYSEDLTGNDKAYTLTASYNGDCAWNTIERSQRSMVAVPIDTVDGKSHTITSTYYKASNSPTSEFGSEKRRQRVAEPVCVASRGRKPDDPSDRTAGMPTEQRFEAREDGKTNTLTTVSKDNLIAENIGCICHTIQQEVTVRKYECDIEALKSLLRDHKNATCKEIAKKIGKPQTLVDHWFRNDKSFAVPDADVWDDLKTILNIETDKFDRYIKEFEIRDGVYEKANRCYDVRAKMSTLTTSSNDSVIIPVRVGTYPTSDGRTPNSQANRIYSTDGKSTTISAQGGGWGAKTGRYAVSGQTYEVKDGKINIKGKQYPIKLADGFYNIRKLTVSECKRLQTVPEWYDFSCVSDTQAYKMLGNGWTVEVIAHLIRSALADKGEGIFVDGQMMLF